MSEPLPSESNVSDAPLQRLLRANIARSGRITFARYMELALYHARLGYYAQNAELGSSGDFFTSAELHPAFAATITAQAHRLWLTMNRPSAFDLVEVGGGSGRFARDVLSYVEHQFPDLSDVLRYRIDDRGETLRTQQRARLANAGLMDCVSWTGGSSAAWPVQSIRGLVVANELLDALPVHLITARDGQPRELYVTVEDGSLRLTPGPLSTPRLTSYLRRVVDRVPDGAQWEINLRAPRWLRRTGRAIETGALLIIDYGYEAPQLYSQNRPQGTLLSYAGHTVTSDPLQNPGQRDITSHVDFTTTRRVLQSLGLHELLYASQRAVLEAAGLPAWREWTMAQSGTWANRQARSRSLDALTDPAGLGAVRWHMTGRGIAAHELQAAPPPPNPLPFDHLQLPDATALDPFPDIESQWQEMWEEDDD